MFNTERQMAMFKEKKSFIDGISEVFETHPVGIAIESIDYEVYRKVITDDIDYHVEYVVVNFTGGVKSPVVVTGNSNIANFKVISRIISGGYYDEVLEYEALTEQDFVKVEL